MIWLSTLFSNQLIRTAVSKCEPCTNSLTNTFCPTFVICSINHQLVIAQIWMHGGAIQIGACVIPPCVLWLKTYLRMLCCIEKHRSQGGVFAYVTHCKPTWTTK